MVFKNSRYRKIPDEVTLDSKGRLLTSKSFRPQPEVTGTFLHTIADGDRLDHLAYKYYNQPRKWWRICDANPEIMSPQALLGKTPFITQQFFLSFSSAQGQPPWSMLLRKITDQVGVKDCYLGDDENSLIVTFNQITLQSSQLVEIVEEFNEFDFTVGHLQVIGRTGKQIVIPPDTVG